MKFSLPVIPLKEFQIVSGSYVDWRGDVMDPTLNLKAQERMRASVADGDDGSGSRMVNFDVSIALKGRLASPELVFDLSAPEDATVENQLQAMGAEERSKQAITMMATGIYLNDSGKGGGLTMGSALNSVLQSQINALAGGMKGASFSVGIEDRTSAETGDSRPTTVSVTPSASSTTGCRSLSAVRCRPEPMPPMMWSRSSTISRWNTDSTLRVPDTSVPSTTRTMRVCSTGRLPNGCRSGTAPQDGPPERALYF